MAKKDKGTGPTKAERKALRQREAEIMAELEARAAKPVKPKSKAPKVIDTPDFGAMKPKALKAMARDGEQPKAWRKAARREIERRDDVWRESEVKAAQPVKPTPPAKPEKSKGGKSAKAKVIEAADDVLAGASSPDAIVAAETAKAAASEAGDDETDAQIKARVKAKREARAAESVKGASGKPVANDIAGSARAEDALEGESEVDYQWRKQREAEAADESAAASFGGTDPDNAPDPKPTKASKAKAQVVEPVETEEGTIYAAGEVSDAELFAKPSEAPVVDFETNGNGQYKVKRPSDGKIVGYTRVTTFIGTNEDRTLLERWKLRILLEGVALNDTFDPSGSADRIDEPVVAKVRDLMHVRDVAIAKARKKDRKGELAPGQYGTAVEAAWSAFKKALDALGEDLLELGGAHEKAAKGTQLHELTELYDREGIDAVGELLVNGEITHADLADVEAYARAIEAAGIKILPEYIEAPVVIHDEKIAGRLDRVVMARLPGAARASRYVFDTKTGRIDLGAGKIAQQLEKYARATPYDLDTHETLAPHKASMTKGLVLHLVPGSAEAHIYVVDLGAGRIGNDLSAKVRAFRNDGKRAIDLTADLAAQTSAVAS